jgi:hypothetical protein
MWQPLFYFGRAKNVPISAPEFLLVAICALFSGCSDRSESLPVTIRSPSVGYPLAIKLRDKWAPGSYLTSVLVIWDYSEGAFEPQSIKHDFTVPGASSSIFNVTLDNIKHRAYASTNAAAPLSLTIAIPVVPPLDLSGKSSWEVLDMAKKVGLDNFCSAVEKRRGELSIYFHLEATDLATVWHVRARGWNKKGDIGQIQMEVDGTSGTITRCSSRQFQ